MTKQELATNALMNAVKNNSEANYQAIFEGFEEKGIDPEAIEPRVNVFTFNAWLALGRAVKKGEKGVKILTVVEGATIDKKTGEAKKVKKAKTTTVFHISQTQLIEGVAA